MTGIGQDLGNDGQALYPNSGDSYMYFPKLPELCFSKADFYCLQITLNKIDPK